MRGMAWGCWTMAVVAALGVAAWLLGLGDVVRESIAGGYLLDWIMGGLCLLWLLVILKAPWDLYFQAHEVAFEIQRSQERHVPTAEGRAAYIRTLRRRLGWMAVGAHVLSAAVIAAAAYFSGGTVGYYFAAFYLISTAFRPGVAGYVYLSRKLRLIGEEVHYPREDVVKLRWDLDEIKSRLKALMELMEAQQKALEEEKAARTAEVRELRQKTHAISREFETTVSRLTDNQEVIKGIQAFVRLIAQSSQA